LSGVEGGVIRAAEENSETIPRGILGEIFVRDSGVLFEPLLGCELFEGGSEFAVDLCPCLLESGRRNGIGERSVRIAYVDLIQLGMQTLAEAEEREHSVVYGGEMADEVEQAVSSRSHLFL
jgi:hypothetical protein